MNQAQTVFSSLQPDWQKWIMENLDRACDPLEMANSMARAGQYSMIVSQAAIAEAMAQRAGAGDAAGAFPVPQAMPFIDTSHNAVAAPDREV